MPSFFLSAFVLLHRSQSGTSFLAMSHTKVSHAKRRKDRPAAPPTVLAAGPSAVASTSQTTKKHKKKKSKKQQQQQQTHDVVVPPLPASPSDLGTGLTGQSEGRGRAGGEAEYEKVGEREEGGADVEMRPVEGQEVPPAPLAVETKKERKARKAARRARKDAEAEAKAKRKEETVDAQGEEPSRAASPSLSASEKRPADVEREVSLSLSR